MGFPHEDEVSKLVYAIQEERLEEVRQLLGKEMDPTAKNFMVLRACADQSSVEIAEMIYNCGHISSAIQARLLLPGHLKTRSFPVIPKLRRSSSKTGRV
jgi:hypothetical protein